MISRTTGEDNSDDNIFTIYQLNLVNSRVYFCFSKKERSFRKALTKDVLEVNKKKIEQKLNRLVMLSICKTVSSAV